MAAETFDTRVVSTRELAPFVREIVLERVDGAPFVFEPGQWVNLMLEIDGQPIKRAYSIASPPDGTPRFELAVTKVTGGPASELLHTLRPGAPLRAIGPQGLFTRVPSDSSPALFVATGTGLTPLRSMIRAAERAGSTSPAWLLFGARYESDVLYRDELEAWARAPGHRYEITLSQGGEAWSGRRGYVQQHLPELLSALASTAPRPHVYVCGLERMVKAVRDLCRDDLGMDRKHVHTERYD